MKKKEKKTEISLQFVKVNVQKKKTKSKEII